MSSMPENGASGVDTDWNSSALGSSWVRPSGRASEMKRKIRGKVMIRRKVHIIWLQSKSDQLQEYQKPALSQKEKENLAPFSNFKWQENTRASLSF